MLEVYRNVSSYTKQALEKSIKSLREGISGGKYNMETVELLKERMENLEDCFIKIELDF